MRKLIATTLEDVAEFELHEAADGVEALEVARPSRPSLVFLDVDMPRLDGIDACRLLRADEGTSATTIVMLTAAHGDAVERQAEEAGADLFLTKPFSPLDLLRLVDGLRPVRLVTFAIGDDGQRVGSLRSGRVIEELEAADMLEWLRGSGRHATGATHRLDDVRLLAPVPSPPSVRDFYAYEGHVRAGFQRRGAPEIPDAWYEAPVFYFSNPAAVFGPGQAVSRPASCQMLDFELEIAAVIGPREEIAGFALLNDWSARDIQRRETTVGLGPAKGKDFATSLGPWLVSPDELPFDGQRLELEATVAVNGRVVAAASTKPMHFSWPDLVSQAARNTRLRPGDVLGSGTLTGGSLLDVGTLDGRWIEPGDEVVLAAPGLGELRTPVVG